MAIFKANYVKRGKNARDLAKASVRYIQHRRGKDGNTITRTLFGSDGPMERHEAYRMIDEATKGSFFYRFVLSPDPKREDNNHDLDMRDIAMQTMLALEDRLGQSVLWVGAVHADHAPHLHAHLIAIVPHKLNVKDFEMLRQATTAAALEQRRFLDLMRTHERERPYPLPAFAGYQPAPGFAPTPRNVTHGSHRYTTTGKTVPSGLKYASWGKSHAASKQATAQQTHAFWHAPRARPFPRLSTCTCPRCQRGHVHDKGEWAHTCSCGLTLHKKRALTLQKGKGRELARELTM
jgi:hypothetical protein